MARLVVITDPQIAPGFQLAGVEVISASDVDSARAHVLALLNDVNVGLIAVSAALLEQLDDATRRRIEASYKPVVVALPMGEPATGAADRRAYLAALIRRAIGFQITFPGRGETAQPG